MFRRRPAIAATISVFISGWGVDPQVGRVETASVVYAGRARYDAAFLPLLRIHHDFSGREISSV